MLPIILAYEGKEKMYCYQVIHSNQKNNKVTPMAYMPLEEKAP